jgi:hypothetical protein
LVTLSIRIDPDGRVRTDPRPFAAKTGRSQPGGSNLFLLPKFKRGFIEPPPGMGLALGDYSQQEPLIAAITSHDAALYRAYQDGDVYIGIGKMLNLIPPE